MSTHRPEPDAAPNAGILPGAGPNALNARVLTSALRKYKWLVLGVIAVCGVGTAFVSLRLPKRYESACIIEFDPSPMRPLNRDVTDLQQPLTSYWSTREWLATQQKVIKSRRVCEMVVQRLALHRDPGFFGVTDTRPGEWRGVSIAEAAQALEGRITIEPVRDTRLVTITASDSTAERAMLIANAVADAYIEKSKSDRMGSTVHAVDWLSSQLDTLRGELQTAEHSLYEFKRAHKVLSVSLEDRVNLTASDIQRFSEALGNARANRIALEARFRSLQQLNVEDPTEVHSTLLDQSEIVGNLRLQIREATTERAVLATHYGDAHPKIQELDAKVAEARIALRSEIDGQIRNVQAEVREARDVESGLRKALEDVNADALRLSLDEIQYNALNRERDNKARLYGVLLQNTADTSLTRMLQVENVRILDRALKPGAPVAPNVRLNVMVGTGAGVLLGLLLALGLSMLDRSIRTPDEVEALGATVLGILPTIDPEPAQAATRRKRGGPDPRGRDLYAFMHPSSPVAECTRSVRTNLTFMTATSKLRSILITSASPQEGKTTVATNLAITIAQMGKRVLLIDTDLRRPRIHRSFGVPMDTGVTSVLVGDTTLAEAIKTSEVPNLWILPCGPIPPNPSELLHTDTFGALLDEACKSFDQVILDSPPLAAVTDAAIIAPRVGGTVVVARFRKTHRDLLASLVRQIRDVGATLYGSVINAVDLSAGTYGTGQYYYYRREEYGSKSEETDAALKERDAE